LTDLVVASGQLNTQYRDTGANETKYQGKKVAATKDNFKAFSVILFSNENEMTD